MKESTSKEKVLKKIRDALVDRMPLPYEKVDMDSPLYVRPESEYMEETFAKAFIEANGKFVFCSNVDEMVNSLHTLVKTLNLRKLYYSEDFLTGMLQNLDVDLVNDPDEVIACDASVTSCEVLIARHGSIVCSSSEKRGRKGLVVPPVHIVVATNTQLVPGIDDAMRHLQKKYEQHMPSLVSFITGPSRTADIEKTLVHGAHGPKELYLFLLDMQNDEHANT